jgi:hypothetical protein
MQRKVTLSHFSRLRFVIICTWILLERSMYWGYTLQIRSGKMDQLKPSLLSSHQPRQYSTFSLRLIETI